MDGKILIALTISASLLFCSALIKKLVRGSPFRLADFYLASDILLASLTTEIIFTLQSMRSSGPSAVVAAANAGMMAITTLFLFVVMSAQQALEGKALVADTPLHKNAKFWTLAVLCNFFAVTTLGFSIAIAYGVLGGVS